MDNFGIRDSLPPARPLSDDILDVIPSDSPTSARSARPPNPTERRDGETRPQRNGPVMRVLLALASLRLTVVLFTLAIILVFLGTLAQVDEGIWTVLYKYFRCKTIAWIPFQTFVRFGQVFLGVPSSLEVAGSFPYPGGWLLGGLLLINLLAAHAVRFQLTLKRSGILLLHSGLIVLMLSELVTGVYQVESRMTIEKGKSTNYVEDFRDSELAILTPADAETDNVVAIPGSLLRKGGVISHEALPFDVEVVRYMVNSGAPQEVTPGTPNLATAGDGLNVIIPPKREASGASADQAVDVPSAYVTLKRKDSGEALGTYLVSVWFWDPRLSKLRLPQQVILDGKTYDLVLRFKREYKPYTMHLLEFTHEKYPGSDKPRDYCSRVRLVDPTRNEDREVAISMNKPFRYGVYNPFSASGETFYQADFFRDGRVGTILQVVRNPGWAMPYIACAMVAVGLLVHCLIRLAGFLDRVGFKVPVSTGGIPRFLPAALLVPAFLLLFVIRMPRPERDDEFHLHEFGKIPVQADGRIKPIGSFARNSLKTISGKATFRDDYGAEQPATKWLLDTLTFSADQHNASAKYRVFRIENDQILTLLGLKPRAGYRYALDEFIDRIDLIQEKARVADAKDRNEREVFDVKILELASHLQLFMEINQRKKLRVGLPPEGQEEWPTLESLAPTQTVMDQGKLALHPFYRILLAYRLNNAGAFNHEVSDYRSQLAAKRPADSWYSALEVYILHDFHPFGVSMVLYLIVFGLACLGLLTSKPVFDQAAFWVAVLGLLIHTGGLLTRILIQGHPPVTNLYSSAIFVGWVCVGMALFLELIFRNCIPVLVAGVLGCVTILLGEEVFAADGLDTLPTMQAVLNTRFWLAVHVLAVSTGYGATLFAGALGIVYLILRVASADQEALKVVSTMIYGVVCFAMFFSFTGTVLGGLWADWSWGRFWGWDPKENGALLVVLSNALILHARWAGMVKQTGVAVLAICGNIITCWSWMGTNQLGIGLHAYGFSSMLSKVLVGIWIAHFLILGLALLPAGKLQSTGSSRPTVRRAKG